MKCAFLSVLLMEEFPDEVVLEDLCCHFQKKWILVPLEFPSILPPILASPAIDLPMLSLFLDLDVDKYWYLQLYSTELVKCGSLDKPGTTTGTKLSQKRGIIS